MILGVFVDKSGITEYNAQLQQRKIKKITVGNTHGISLFLYDHF